MAGLVRFGRLGYPASIPSPVRGGAELVRPFRLNGLKIAKDGPMHRVTAGWQFASMAGLLLVTTGCDWIPVRRRVDPALYPATSRPPSEMSPPELAESDGAKPTSAPLPPLPELHPFSEAELARATAPTPLLDEALARAELVERATSEAVEDDAPRDPEARPILQLADPEPAPMPLAVEPVTPPAPAEPTPPPFEPAPGPPVEPPAREPFVALPTQAMVLSSSETSEVGARPTSDDTTLWTTVMELMAEKSGESAPIEGSGENRPTLRIADSRLCTRVDGYRSFQAADPSKCRAGQSLLVYCEVEGVSYEPEGPRFRSDLQMRVELVDASTGRVVWSDDRPVRDVADAPRQEFFMTYKDWELPDELEDGRYLLNTQLVDEQTGDRARRGLVLIVVE